MRPNRALLVALLVLGLTIAAVTLRQVGTGLMPPCLFREMTGLECPGCGMTRGTYALFHGDFLKAFLFNPVGMIVLPLGLTAIGIQLIGWVFGKSINLNPGRWGATFLAVVVITWFVVRNVI